MAVIFNSNISVLAPLNTDAKYGVWSGADINTAKANALAGVASGVRAIGMTVGLYVGGNTTEYWFQSGTTNADLVEKTSGSTVSSGNLITVAIGGQIDFTGGTNTQEVIIENTNEFPFIFTANDDVDNLTFQGNANNGNIRLSFNTFDVGQVYFNFGTSPQVDFTSNTPNSGSVNLNFEDSSSFFQTNSMNVNFGILPSQSVTLNGTNDGGGGSEVNLNLYPATNTNGSFINFSQTHLHFAFFDGTNTTEVARFGGNATANFLVYNNMTVGANSAPSNAILDVHQTGNTKANLRLTGLATSDNARLDFTPFAGSDGVINNSTNTKIFFWTNGSGTSYYDASLFYFGSNRVQINTTLSSNQSALLIDPSYTSTGNNAILVSGSSTRTSTNGLNINLGLTGATSNSILVSSAISASSLLGRSVNISPSFTATANNDVLQSLYLNPTFASGAFTGVNSYSIFSNNGRTYYDAGIINSTTQPAHFFTWNALTGSGNIAQGVVINGTSTSSSTNDALLDVQNATSSIFLVRRASVVFGTATINVPNGATIQPAGSQSVLNLSVTNGRRIVVSGDSTQNTAPAGGFKNFSQSHTASGTINSGNFTNLLLNDTFNFSSVTSGNPVARSIFINTAYTAGTNTVYRAIEVSNGDVFFGTTSGGLGVGASTTISDSAIFQVTSTTKGVLFPRMTTGQKTAITNVAGLVIYDTTLNKLCVNNGGGWETITSS